MKNNILSHLLIGLSCLFIVPLLSGCKDYLDEANPSQLTKESFWKTLDDADQGVTSVYNRFKDGSIYGTEINNWSDLTFPGFGNRVSTTNELYMENFTNSTKFVG